MSLFDFGYPLWVFGLFDLAVQSFDYDRTLKLIQKSVVRDYDRTLKLIQKSVVRDYERTLKLIQKRVVRTKFDIYVFI